MSTEIAVRPRELVSLTNDQLQFISRTEFVPAALRGNLPAILACVATGRALGIADMIALRSIHIIDGKATFSAELMVQLVRAKGHSIVGDVTDRSVTVTGTRADNGDSMTVTWTVEMADRAGLLSKSNWKKYPEAMLWARAASQLCRMLFADCFAGATYTPEELDETEIASGEELLDEQPMGETSPVETPVEEPSSEFISDPQRRRLFAIASENGVGEDQLRDYVEQVTGQRSTAQIPRSRYDALIELIEVPF